MKNSFKTTAIYISGAICGKMWMPASQGAILFRKDLKKGSCYREKRDSFREILNGLLGRYGGDFQNAAFTSDTVLRIERRCIESPGKYSVHVFERTIAELKDCQDLTNEDCTASDFNLFD